MTTELDYTDYVHTGPGTLAGRYLRRFWLPVSRSQDVAAGRAIPIEIMGEKLTLYRGEDGDPHLVAWRCAHRGTQLSSGWVEGDAIRCRYHGWKYDSSGQCIEQPGESESFAAKVKINSYPVRDYIGLVYAYMGEGEPAEFPRMPAFEGEQGVLSVGLPEIWPCNYYNRMDNDPAHPPYTHRVSTLRAGGTPKPVKVLSAEETDYGFRVAVDRLRHYNHRFWPVILYHRNEGPRGGDLPKGQSKAGPGYDASARRDRNLYYMPVNDEKMVCFTVDFVHVTGEDAERYLERREEELKHGFGPLEEMAEDILAGKMTLEDMPTSLTTYQTFRVEDYVTIVGQGRIADRDAEHLGRIDGQNILSRKIWVRELKALGEGQPLKEWQIPWDASEMMVPESVLLGSE